MTSRAQLKAPGTSLIPVQATEADLSRPLDLTDMQHAFCMGYVQAGDGNATAAARKAGYAPSSCRKVGWLLLQRAEVQSHIRNLTMALLASSAPIAALTMQKLALSARSEMVRQHAAADILDRVGFKPPEQHQHLVSGGVTVNIDLG